MIQSGLAVHHTFWLTPGHASEPNVWYAGSSPPGLFRSKDGGQTWESVPGFNEHPMRSAWVGGKPATYVTRNAGKSWQRQDQGLPKEQGWFTVKRQAMATDAHEPVGVYFGTTSGEIWASRNEGKSWTCLARYLPEVYSIEVAERAR